MQFMIPLLLLLLLVIAAISLCGWVETRAIWNGGRCAENGLPWRVLETPGGLYLFAGSVGRRIRWPLVYGPIIDNARLSGGIYGD